MEKITECPNCGWKIEKADIRRQQDPNAPKWIGLGYCSTDCFREHSQIGKKSKSKSSQYLTKSKIKSKPKAKGKQVDLLGLVRISIVSYISTLVVLTAILFAINLSNNDDRQFSDLYLLLIISYFIAGVVATWRCSSYTIAVSKEILNPLPIVITVAIVLLTWYTLNPLSDLISNLGEKHFDLTVTVPERLQNIRGLSINAIVTFVLGWAIPAFQ